MFSCLSFGYSFKLVHSISLFLILIVVRSFTSRGYKSLIILIGFFSSAYLPVALTYGSPDYNAIANILYASKSESLEFLKAIPWFYYVTPLMGIVLTLMAFNVKIGKVKYRGWIILYIIIYLFSPSVKAYMKTGALPLFSNGLPIIKASSEAVSNYLTFVEQSAFLKQQMSLPDRWVPQKTSADYQLYILVIGESVRSDYMQAYGFKIKNTPFMSSASGVTFTNYISAASSTVMSLLNSLTLRINEQPDSSSNIVSLANKAGFSTYWYSNQGMIGEGETPVSVIAMNAESVSFIKKGEYQQNKYVPDIRMLPQIRWAISENKPVKLIVIHLIGSHSRACSRTNEKYSTFSQSKEISCYIESIAQTDKLLADVADMAKASGKSWSMMYFADHGLEFSDKDTQYARLIHGDKFKQNYRVPMFITASDSHERKTVDRPRSALNFLSLFSQWTGIKDKLINSDCNMMANVPCNNQDTVIKFDQSKVYFSSLAQDSAAH